MEPAEEKEDHMTRRKGKSVSFDAMIKFFMQYYNIPTKKDIEKLIERMDQLEKVIKESELYGKGDRISTLTSSKETRSTSRSAETSYNMVLEVIKRFKNGVEFSEIQERTGFGEKKLRNIIYRLHKMNKIARKSRGIYIAS
jgi:DNA-binding Lrp family transcriptional regulator